MGTKRTMKVLLALALSFVAIGVGSTVAPKALAASRSQNGSGDSFTYSGSRECPSPPTGWDPTTATAAQLRFYGLPLPHASEGPAYQTWVDNMQHVRQRICGGEVVSKYHTDTLSTHAGIGTAGTNGDYWSGYADTASGFNFINGEWDVPCYSGTSNSQRALEWIGLGGYNSSNLWQAGTETDHANGYRFWYEYVPGSNIIYAGPAVACGDSVYVALDYNQTVPGKSYVYMYNYVNGQYWSTSKSFVPSNNSAEWIVERTSCGTNKNWALTPFGTVSWWSLSAASSNYANDVNEPLTYFSHAELNMYQNGVDLSDNSTVSGGNSFATFYHNSGTSYC